MKIDTAKIETIIPYARNPRKNDAAVDGVAASIKEFGFQQPIVVDKDNVIIVGHTRLKAAQKLGLKTVPVVHAEDLTPEQVKAYRLLDNKLNEKAEWNPELLQLELEEMELDLAPFDVTFPAIGENDPETEWQGMPEFDQPDATPHRSIIVHFESDEAVRDFCNRIEQTVTEKTKSIFHPIKLRVSRKEYRCTDDSEE